MARTARIFALLRRRLGGASIETLGGLLLLGATFAALWWANLAHDSYERLWHTTLGIRAGSLEFSQSLQHWINDGLMVIFFLLVGLEIKRELIEGELSTARRATLPALAAVGGMVMPAAIYLAIAGGGAAARGWAIPVATDIAFVVGLLGLLGKRAPTSLKVVLTALAIVDDIGAVLVIAIAYTDQLSVPALAAAGGIFAALLVLNRAEVRSIPLYALFGVGLWLAVLRSGVHATVAGVLLAVTLPAHPRLRRAALDAKLRETLTRSAPEDGLAGRHGEWITAPERVGDLEQLASDGISPLHRLEHALRPSVMFVIMPLFALANAGVPLAAPTGAEAHWPVTIGVALGLLAGKPLGIMLAAVIAERLHLAHRPPGLSWRQLHGGAWLAGIGFTMSLFISSLAFAGDPRLLWSKLGLLAGSAVAGLVGVSLLMLSPGRGETKPVKSLVG